MGHCEAPADHPAVKDCHGLEGAEMCRGEGQPLIVTGCVMWCLWALRWVLQRGGALRLVSLAAFCCNGLLSFRTRHQLCLAALAPLGKCLLAGDFSSHPARLPVAADSEVALAEAALSALLAAPSLCCGAVILVTAMELHMEKGAATFLISLL